MGELEPWHFEEHERIKDIYASSVAALAAGDIEALSGYYTQDAVQLPPDAVPLVGWQQISKSLEKELAGITFNTAIHVEEIIVFGDCAVAWGHFRATVIPQAGDSPSRTSGSFLDVLLRGSDGTWKIARSAWSSHELDKYRQPSS